MLGPQYKDVGLSAESIQVIGPRAYLGTNVGLIILDVSNPARTTQGIATLAVAPPAGMHRAARDLVGQNLDHYLRLD